MALRHLFTWLLLGTRTLGLYLWFACICRNRTSFYSRVLQLFRNENILFTKVFQSLANSPALNMSPEFRAELVPYTTQVSYNNNEIDYAIIDQVEEDYQVSIDRTVINSGMIALVFRGTQKIEDGSKKDIILKLKRHGIEEHIRQGCESTRYMFQLAAYFYPRNIFLRILRPFIENLEDIIEQCNFEHEISNCRQAKEDFSELNFIQIPTILNRSTSQTDFILMDRIEGTHVLPSETSEADRLRYLTYFANFTTYAFLSNSIQHTDLHAGNVLFMPTGLGIIDYGMALQPSDELHEIMLSIAEIFRNKTPVSDIDYVKKWKYMFIPVLDNDEIADPVAFRTVCENIFGHLTNNIDLDHLHVADHLEQMSATLNNPIQLHPEMYKILLSSSMMGCIHATLGSNHEHLKDRIQQIEMAALDKAFAMIM